MFLRSAPPLFMPLASGRAHFYSYHAFGLAAGSLPQLPLYSLFTTHTSLRIRIRTSTNFLSYSKGCWRRKPPCASHDALCALADRTAYACLARGAPSFGDLHWPRATAIPRPSPRRRFPRHGVLHALQPGQHLCTQSCYAICARCNAATLRVDTREVSVVDAGCRRIRRANAPPPHPSTTRSG